MFWGVIVYNGVTRYISTYIFLDESTQTSTSLSWGTPRKTFLRKKIKILQKEANAPKCKQLLENDVTIEDVEKFLDKKYSVEASKLLKTQLKLLNRAPRGSRYSEEFKQFALSVYFLGPKAYKKMSTVFRLPAKATLERFTRKWAINPGFNDFIFRLLEFRVRRMKEKEKDCLLVLDEMSLKSHLFYDISRDKIIGFQTENNETSAKIASSALVVMVRGIASSWKQPLAYFFYKSTAAADEAKDILFESVRRLNVIGFNVLAVVSDQGPNFQKLVKTSLKLNENNLFFYVDSLRILYLFDVPHLLKSTRNNFFSYIFELEDGKTSKSYLETFYNYDKVKEYRLCPKLSNDHIYPNNFQKMKVKLASQVFSHSVAAALNTYIDFQFLPQDAKITAKFIKNMNDLFDLLNSCHLNNFNAFMGTERQVTFLNEMLALFENLKILNHDKKILLTK